MQSYRTKCRIIWTWRKSKCGVWWHNQPLQLSWLM